VDVLHLLIGRNAEAQSRKLSGIFLHEDYQHIVKTRTLHH
jgi:hypothetical protein